MLHVPGLHVPGMFTQQLHAQLHTKLHAPGTPMGRCTGCKCKVGERGKQHSKSHKYCGMYSLPL
jgi:hypothetical protein